MALFDLSDLLSGVKHLYTKTQGSVTTCTLQNAVSATGNGSDFTVDGYGVATLQVTGTFSATVTFYGSVDGTNFINIPAYNRNLKTYVMSTTTTGLYEIDCRGIQKIRASVTWTSGTSISIVGRAEPFSGTNSAIELSGSNIVELMSDMDAIKERQEEVWRTINILTQKQAPPEIFGVKWDKGSVPTLTRTDDAANLTANAGVGFSSVTNDFDSKPIYGEIEQVEDALGNTFMKVPKCYCRDTDGVDHKQMQISKRRYPGFYLPYLFWDFANNKELDYALIGKHQASLGSGNKLESKPNKYPLINTNIVNFRTYAKNNNVDGLTGYQQNDIHWIDLLRKLMIIEFATLDIQAVMKGYTEGQYAATHLATVTETGVNRIVVANAHADLYRVGQSISVGTSQGGNQIFYGRTITSIDVYDASNKAITFDGDPVNITTGNMLYNSGWKTGFSNQLLASSGSIVANDGKYPCVYRGIESPFGDVWEWVDGLNVNDHQAWICKNADDYASNLFASPYEPLGYTNHNANGYIKEMGLDPNYPFAQLPTAITGSTTPTQYYGDYYYQDVGQRVARFGGYWSDGSPAGLSSWS